MGDSKTRKSEAMLAAMDDSDLSGHSEAASRIGQAIPRNDAGQKIDECEDDDNEYFEDDVEWHAGDCDDELDESADIVGPPPDDPEHLEKFDGHLEDALKCMHQQVAISQEARELLSRVKSARSCFLVVGIGAFDGLAQPSTARKLAKSRGKGKKGKRKGKSSSHGGVQFPSFGKLGVLPKPSTSLSESRPPMSKKRPTEAGTSRGVPHHALRLRLDQCMLCRQSGHRASECPNKRDATSLSLGKRAFGHLRSELCCVPCRILWCDGRRNRRRSRRR